ncbi:MAG: sigma-54 dependent transcriptional regulator [Proteobacteria bacterium]|nr:sigma-54 dependent transcriptional regulator [Pseudomonadota bacterium]MBU1583687.1 sigma-54 dependent transcriptional regulator [Pseudomonadota bacterium]MBU2456038.1 sigma-54 dependent transcriptional regulator [Pseudomonadota bacterium]MBU2628287.1 sigma-54 dependent transcriptional regulator [Pseudomonadota bacterium]
MKDILVLSTRTNDFDLISKVLSKTCTVKQGSDLETAITLHSRSPFDMIIADITLLEQNLEIHSFSFLKNPFTKINPFVQFVVLCSRKEIQKAVKAVNQGAAGYLTLPIEEKEIGLLLTSVDKTLAKAFELDYLRDHFWKTEWLEIIRSKNPRMKNIYENIRSVSPTIATVLLLGDTGTGKGLLARLVHLHSQRSEQPFIAVHCGAIPDTLIESELFGHEKGAFTGADRRKPGKFEMARGGTIFLDEIGTITASAQIKLLQVLQDGTFSRIGGNSLLKADTRIIAATNADLAELVKKNTFRKDLFYRLNIFPIEIPLLRDRLEDLSNLTDMFLKNLNAKYGKGIHDLHPSVAAGFKQYDWPGNIRELENILERAYILERSCVLTPENFPPEMVLHTKDETLSGKNTSSLAQARQIAIEVFERSYLISLLELTHGKINLSAQKAGITTRQMNRLLNRYGLDKKKFKK